MEDPGVNLGTGLPAWSRVKRVFGLQREPHLDRIHLEAFGELLHGPMVAYGVS